VTVLLANDVEEEAEISEADPLRRRRMGAQARVLTEREFGVERVAKYLEI
jgi:hypothetical protein